jgi:hypothetical protein
VTQQDEREQTFNESALQRLAASSMDYYLSHGEYVPALALRCLDEIRKREDAEDCVQGCKDPGWGGGLKPSG